MNSNTKWREYSQYVCWHPYWWRNQMISQLDKYRRSCSTVCHKVFMNCCLSLTQRNIEEIKKQLIDKDFKYLKFWIMVILQERKLKEVFVDKSSNIFWFLFRGQAQRIYLLRNIELKYKDAESYGIYLALFVLLAIIQSLPLLRILLRRQWTMNVFTMLHSLCLIRL